MRYYSSNSEVISAWVNQRSEDGRNGNESIWFENLDVIYSYGTYFPMAVRIPGGFYICNGDRYLVTTSAHQSELFRKIPNSRRVEIPFSALANLEDIRQAWGGYNIEAIKEINVLDYENDKYIDTGRVDKNGVVLSSRKRARH